jgi:hypothetical protein
MDDEDVEYVTTVKPQKHTKWSFIVLAADLAANLVREVADTMETGVTLLLQHREHKIEEDDFFEIVWED